MAIALIGVCETAPGSGTVCHHRHTTPNNNNKPPMPPDNPVVLAPVFALAVHYENEAGLQCLEPVTIRMMVLGEETNVTGLAPEEKNGTCAEQASCYLHPDNTICTSLQRSVPYDVEWGLDAAGKIFECDITDEPYEKSCRIKNGCFASSIYPSCVQQVYTIKELLQNPTVIQRQNPTGVEAFSYLLLYSDNNCHNLQGLRSFVKGPQDVVLASPMAANVTCENSLLCLSNPNGTKCLGLGYDQTQTIVTNVRNDSQVEKCDDNGDCNLASTECIVSFVPGCYQRWPSATVLFSNPAAFVA